jgi:hypothetical protein
MDPADGSKTEKDDPLLDDQLTQMGTHIHTLFFLGGSG